MTTLSLPNLLPLEPQYRERVWGGQKLREADPPIGEAWIAFEDSRVKSGTLAGRTVADITRDHARHVLGTAVAERYGTRFPLLIKLLDCADWLSVQVHPNDEQASRLVGPGHFGKTEAWHFLEVDAEATILAGVKPGTTREELARAIRSGRVLDVAARQAVSAGESVFIPAGTLHALGPGMLLYEVQQVSDTTYRVYDWDRPASAGRQLHIEESVEVTNPTMSPGVAPAPSIPGTGAAVTVTSEYFELEVVQLRGDVLTSSTEDRSAHVLTLVDGEAGVSSGSEDIRLGRFDSVIVAGGAGEYVIRASGSSARLLRARVP